MPISISQPGEAAALEGLENAPWGHRFSPRNEGLLWGFREDLVKYPGSLSLKDDLGMARRHVRTRGGVWTHFWGCVVFSSTAISPAKPLWFRVI